MSAVILDRGSLDVALEMLKPECFYAYSNSRIFEAVRELAAADTPVDIVSVASWLRDRKRLERIGGAAYLAQLADATPSFANIGAHAKVVHDKWRVRQLIATCQRIAAEGYGDYGDASEFVDSAEARVHAVTTEPHNRTVPTMRETLQEVFSKLQDTDVEPGVWSGLKDLDRLMGPMKAGQLVVIGAHSGIGKSAIGMQMVLNIAMASSDPRSGAMVFSHEMTRDELAERALFSQARVDSSKISNKRSITEEEWRQVAEAARHLALDNVWFDDTPGMTPLQIRSKARLVQSDAAHRSTSLRVVLVDYLQLLDGTAGGKKQSERREREIAYCSQKLKELAKEQRVVVILLAQLNDDSRREKRPPRKEDLRECKAVAQDADKVILLHNPAAAERALARRRGLDVERPLESEFVDIIVDKNRGGRTGKVGALFFPSYVLFADPADEDYDRFDRNNR